MIFGTYVPPLTLRPPYTLCQEDPESLYIRHLPPLSSRQTQPRSNYLVPRLLFSPSQTS